MHAHNMLLGGSGYEEAVSVLGHPLFAELRPYFKVERCAGDGWAKPRVRLEIRRLPPELYARALEMRMACVACGAIISPVRQRRAPKRRGESTGGLYFAPCCPLSQRIGCSRGPAAHLEYDRVTAAVEAAPEAAA
jgi:hypothetical protein